MNALLKELLQMPEARALLDSTLRRDKPMVTGVSPVHRAMLAAAMFQETGRPMLLLCGLAAAAQRRGQPQLGTSASGGAVRHGAWRGTAGGGRH